MVNMRYRHCEKRSDEAIHVLWIATAPPRRLAMTMPSHTNATPITARQARGFTLLELLATMVIIGILVSLAVLSIGDPRPQRLKLAGEQFESVTRLAQEQALFSGEELGIAFWKYGYEFVRREQDKWLTIPDNPSLRPRDLPAGVTLLLVLEGAKIELLTKRLSGKPPEFQPHVLLMSSGEASPFEVVLEDDASGKLSVISDALGNISLETASVSQ
jgi:general secretion pathway protein H